MLIQITWLMPFKNNDNDDCYCSKCFISDHLLKWLFLFFPFILIRRLSYGNVKGSLGQEVIILRFQPKKSSTRTNFLKYSNCCALLWKLYFVWCMKPKFLLHSSAIFRISNAHTKTLGTSCNAGDLGPIPGLGRSPGGGHDNPLHYSCLENPMDRRVWLAAVHGFAKSGTWLSN